MIRKRTVKMLAFLTAVCVFSQTMPFSLQNSGENAVEGGKNEIRFAGLNVYAGEEPQEAGSQTALIGERFEVNGIGYKKLTENTVQLADWEGAVGNIDIPEKVPGTNLTVVSIGKGVFQDNAQIYQVNMPDTILDIGAYAFSGASWTTITTLPPNLISIGEGAFTAACRHEGMEEYDLVIPDSVTAIGKAAFSSQNYIRSVKLPKNLTRLEAETFRDCEKMTEITFPENLKSIGSYAFLNCKLLDHVDLPDSITEIKSSAFSKCTSLTSITLPEQLTVLSGGLFSGCSSLESITLSANLDTIGGNAFERCTALKEIRIPEGVTRLGAGLFNNCQTEPTVYLEGSLSYVHVWFCGTDYSLRPQCDLEIHCIDEQSAARLFSVGHKNIKINGQAYEAEEADMQFDCGGFTYVILDPEQKLVRLKGKAADAEKVTGELNIPQNVTDADGVEYTVTEIGYRAFPGWQLTKVVFPDTVVHIEKEAFENCTTLTEIHLPVGLVSLGNRAFSGCTGLTGSITVPDSCIDISNGLDGTGYSEIILSKNITEIAQNAFSRCNNLKKITLPENLTKIGFGAFQGLTELEEVSIPKHLGEIEEIAFNGCVKLKEAPLSDELVSIGINAFNGCTALSGTLVIPDSVEVIMGGAFEGCTGLSAVQAGNGLKLLTGGALPDVEKLIAYDSRVFDILKQNANFTEDAAKLLWDGKSNVPAGAQVWVEDDLVISDSIEIGEGASVTIAPEASVTVAEDGELIIGETGSLAVVTGASVTIDGAVINSGAVDAGGRIVINGELTNAGTGTIAANGEVTINGAVTNNGAIDGSGSFQILQGTLGGNGSYGAGMQFTFDLKESMVADTGDAVYSVTPVSPEPEVSVPLGDDKIVFEKNIDFTYSYENNTAPGQADVTVTPKADGKLTGSPVTKHFMIHKANQEAPEECILTFEQNADNKTFTAVIAEVEGAEYSFDGENWSEENKKEDCQPKTEYTVYIRMKETTTHFASPCAEKTLISPEIRISVTSPEELAAPELKPLKAAAGKTGVYVQVEVNPVSSSDRYEIYRTAGTQTILVKTTESGKTMIQDENPVINAKYYAVAVSKDGKVKSKPGSQKEIKFSKATKIKKVSGSSKGITVTWKKIKNAKKYVLYRSTKKDAGYVKVKSLGKKKLSYLDKKAKKGKKYYYKVVVLTKSQLSLMSKASKKVKK